MSTSRAARAWIVLVAGLVLALIASVLLSPEIEKRATSLERSAAAAPEQNASDRSRPVSPGARPTDFIARSPIEVGEHLVSLVFGMVRDDLGRAQAGALIYAHFEDATQSPLLPRAAQRPPPPAFARATSDLDGRFRLDLPVHTLSYRVTVSCWKNGFRRRHVSGVDIDGTRKELDFTLDAGRSIRGTVHLQGGREGLDLPHEIVATKGLPFRPGARFSVSGEWNLERYEATTSDAECSFGRARIDSRGAFEIAGLEEGEHSLRIVDDGWIVTPPVIVPAGSAEVFVTVVPCQSLIVVARADGRALADFDCLLHLMQLGEDDGNNLSLHASALEGRIVMRLDPLIWGRGAVFPEEGVTVGYRLSAPGFQSQSGSFSVEPRGASVLEVDMGAQKKSLRSLILDLAYEDGSPWPSERALDVSFASPGSREKTTIPAKVDRGRVSVEIPEGTWWLHIKPSGQLGWASAVAVEAQVGPQGGEVLGVRMPKGGTLEILSTRATATAAVLMGPRYCTDLTVPPAGLVLEDATPGTWVLQWGASGLPEGQSSALVVADGRSTLKIDL